MLPNTAHRTCTEHQHGIYFHHNAALTTHRLIFEEPPMHHHSHDLAKLLHIPCIGRITIQKRMLIVSCCCLMHFDEASALAHSILKALRTGEI